MKRRNIKKIINEISKIPWKYGEYRKQNWGIWLHSISSYLGRIKPSFARWLIKISSDKDDIILDPFCGIGTVVLEADLLGRKSFGIDLNPYAYIISKSKFDRRGLKEEIEYLKNIKLNTQKIDLTKVPNYIKEYYHEDTLKEILALRDILIKDKRFFLLGCLLGISHGHRPQHLSIKTGYIIPYIPKPKPKVEYKEVFPRMIKKVRRMYKDPFPLKTKSEIYLADTRNIPLENNSVDIIISSPPYYNTLDYVQSNHLRLYLLGRSYKKQLDLKQKLIQDKNSYLSEMRKCGIEIKRVLKKDGLIIFVLGDVHTLKKSINTAEDISQLYSTIGFKTYAIIPDEIPANRTTIAKFNGKKGILNKKQKMDRILIMSLDK